MQQRIDILSRPQLTTLDNQTANILIGASIPYNNGTTVTTGIATTSIAYRDTGVLMNVTPRITPDGRVLMRVQPEVSALAATEISVGGSLQPAFDVQSVLTTVLVADGETMVIGGLISKQDTKNENKVPWLGDLPYIGAAFRYRTQTKTKKELLVILTPHIIRTWADADRVLYEESRRMDWITGDVLKTQGTSNMEPIIPGPPPGNVDGRMPSPTGPEGAIFPVPMSPPAVAVPAPNGTMPPAPPAPGAIVPPTGGMLPTPRLAPQGTPGQGSVEQQQWTVPPSAPAQTSTEQPVAPRNPEEVREWTVPASR